MLFHCSTKTRVDRRAQEVGGGYFGQKTKEGKCGCAHEMTYTAGMQDSSSPSVYIRQLQSTSSQPSESSFSKSTCDSLGCICICEPQEVLDLASLDFSSR